MMKRNRSLILALTILPVSAWAGSTTVYHTWLGFPPPYSEMTRDDIVGHPTEIWTITADSQRAKLLDILSIGKEAKFNHGDRRTIIVDRDGEYIIDGGGVVLGLDGSSIKIDTDELFAFKATLDIRQVQKLGRIPGTSFDAIYERNSKKSNSHSPQ